MTGKHQRLFTVSPPSTLNLNWLFEFHCTIQDHETSQVVIDIQDDIIGCAQVRIKNPGELWKVWLYVWHQCNVIALNCTVVHNTRDAEHSRLARLEELLG